MCKFGPRRVETEKFEGVWDCSMTSMWMGTGHTHKNDKVVDEGSGTSVNFS